MNPEGFLEQLPQFTEEDRGRDWIAKQLAAKDVFEFYEGLEVFTDYGVATVKRVAKDKILLQGDFDIVREAVAKGDRVMVGSVYFKVLSVSKTKLAVEAVPQVLP